MLAVVLRMAMMLSIAASSNYQPLFIPPQHHVHGCTLHSFWKLHRIPTTPPIAAKAADTALTALTSSSDESSWVLARRRYHVGGDLVSCSLVSALLLLADPPLAQAAEDLRRTLVNLVRIRECIRQLVAKAERQDVSTLALRVKELFKEYGFRQNVDEAESALPRNVRAKGVEHGRDALEYLAQAIEYDGWNKVSKTIPQSRVALKTMTPEKVQFTAQALRASERELNSLLRMFPAAQVLEAEMLCEELYGRQIAEWVAQTDLGIKMRF
ncbi:unnamed protein product [Vitrella brassicaformis CCMP3155]|uniref:Ubiquinone biosynthesis protein n=2 Tax=Vitrella brassicaformis TaxID=1169539 RepID=A0A0G4ERT8_VITBC|nr:unnamed protein product [Vitrella brassicaformis CCMP3155]|eukprot:CEM00575.1 unnamed protein product [Vitrella brassicaformis CCMP3155]